jgi:predicted lipoprotein with Yx(FWY)xxD motif
VSTDPPAPHRFRFIGHSVKLAGAVMAIGLVAAACGSSSTKSSTAASPSTTSPSTSASTAASSTTGGKAVQSSQMSVTIDERSVSGLGPVLTDSQGRTLYIFGPDAQKSVTCTTAACVKVWPPVYGKPVAGSGVKSSLLGTITSGGKTIATYDHWPLYTFVEDTAAGTAKGQAVSGFGGPWYVINPAGTVVKTSPTSSSGKKKAPSGSTGGSTAY